MTRLRILYLPNVVVTIDNDVAERLGLVNDQVVVLPTAIDALSAQDEKREDAVRWTSGVLVGRESAEMNQKNTI